MWDCVNRVSLNLRQISQSQTTPQENTNTHPKGRTKTVTFTQIPDQYSQL